MIGIFLMGVEVGLNPLKNVVGLGWVGLVWLILWWHGRK